MQNITFLGAALEFQFRMDQMKIIGPIEHEICKDLSSFTSMERWNCDCGPVGIVYERAAYGNIPLNSKCQQQ